MFNGKINVTYGIFIVVGGLEHEFYFPYIGNVIIPADYSNILHRGRAQPPTRFGSQKFCFFGGMG